MTRHTGCPVIPAPNIYKTLIIWTIPTMDMWHTYDTNDTQCLSITTNTRTWGFIGKLRLLKHTNIHLARTDGQSNLELSFRDYKSNIFFWYFLLCLRASCKFLQRVWNWQSAAQQPACEPFEKLSGCLFRWEVPQCSTNIFDFWFDRFILLNITYYILV